MQGSSACPVCGREGMEYTGPHKDFCDECAILFAERLAMIDETARVLTAGSAKFGDLALRLQILQSGNEPIAGILTELEGELLEVTKVVRALATFA